MTYILSQSSCIILKTLPCNSDYTEAKDLSHQYIHSNIPKPLTHTIEHKEMLQLTPDLPLGQVCLNKLKKKEVVLKRFTLYPSKWLSSEFKLAALLIKCLWATGDLRVN